VQNSRIYLKCELSYCDYFVCGNFQIFVTMATGVGLTQISLTVKSADPENPYLAQES